ncbi:hypothetical protein FMM56_06755 [Campylobacter sp. LR264d]|uniref:hypothetical protein n=1 Tax=Campylobacter sp. LR264d TaxID=2593544 RepID=UPI00123B32E0|nr:hypothetical protein [Campylobacter sp. LR264d]KAA6230101.1 hypothetical protein FMM56_06755 [Campylobacter sp. LR264d]
MNIIELEFNELKKNFNFESKEEFIKEFKTYIIQFHTNQKKHLKTNGKLELAKAVLNKFKDNKDRVMVNYKIGDLKVHKFEIKDNQTILISKETKIVNKNYEWLYCNKIIKDSELETKILDYIENKKKN